MNRIKIIFKIYQTYEFVIQNLQNRKTDFIF